MERGTGTSGPEEGVRRERERRREGGMEGERDETRASVCERER